MTTCFCCKTKHKNFVVIQLSVEEISCAMRKWYISA